MQKFRDYKGVFFVFISALLYGSYGIWSVLLGKEFGVFFQNYARSGLVLLILIPLCFLGDHWKKVERKYVKYFALVSFFAAFTQVPLFYAYQHAGIGITSLILFSFALFTSFFFGRWFLNERITKIKWISLLIGFGGLVLVFYQSLGSYSALAILMAVLGGIGVGGQTSASKLIPKRFSAIQTSTITWSTSFISSLVLSLGFNERQLVPAFDIHWVSMVAFALAGLLAFYFVIEGYRDVDASIGGLIGISEIVFGVAFGVLFFAETLTPNIVIGSALIVIASSLPNMVGIRGRGRR